MLEENKKRFTLLEFLVVIAIVGFFSILIVVSLSNAEEKNRNAVREADIKNLNNAVQLYIQANNVAPSIMSSSVSGICSSLDKCWFDDLSLSLEPYISSLPIDPINDGDYRYVYISPDALVGSCLACDNTNYQLYVKKMEKQGSVWGFNKSLYSDWISN